MAIKKANININLILAKLTTKTALLIIANAIILLFCLKNIDSYKQFEQKPPYQFVQDTDQYYSYLPAYFVYNDLSFSFDNNYWLIENRNHKRLPKGTMGMAYMYAPFFLIAHYTAKNADYKANGYSKPYSVSIMYGTLFYFVLGCVLLMLSLNLFFNKWVSFITLLSLFFGTNLNYYVLGEGELPHSYLFALYSILIYFLVKWHNNQKAFFLYILSFVFGLIVIIRPVEIFFIVFILLYGVYSKKSLYNKITLLGSNIKSIILAIFFFAIPIIPQLIYWKIYGGDWLVFSYGSKESFFFNDPKIIDFLFSYRKGWLLYTPLMIFSIIGLFFTPKQFKLSTTIFLIVIVYILSSWWCWWFGGGFGMRAMVQYYALLAIPLAAFIEHVFMSKKIWLLTIPFNIFSVYYGYLYFYKYTHWSLHWDSMSKAAYWKTFMKKDLSAEEIGTLDKLMIHPDYEAAQKGDR